MICYGPVTRDTNRLSGLANAPFRTELAQKPHLRAIRVSAHALGRNQPERELILSPQHRLCLSSNIVERITGEHQALISAKDLLDLDGVMF